MKNRLYIFIIIVLSSTALSAQEYHGLTGLLQVPCAETDSAGTFRGNMMFLHQAFLPEEMARHNTFNYGIGLTAWRWLEISYCATLLWMHKNAMADQPMGFYNEDRRINIKATPLYEGKWWPAIAVGWDDVGRPDHFISGAAFGNSYFQNIYIAASKHFNIKGYEIGAHLAYRYYASDINRARRGVAGGVTFRPAFYPPLRLIVEWDGVGVNAGADVLLLRHLFIQACLVHGRGFTGGLSYHYTIPH